MATQKSQVEIIKVSPVAMFEPDGTVTRHVNVSFTVRGQGPFSLQMPSDKLDNKELSKRIKDYAAHIIALLDLKI